MSGDAAPRERSVLRVNRLWGAALTLSAIPAVVLPRWVNFTLDRDLPGYAFSLRGYIPSHSTMSWASFGIVAAVILLVAAVSRLLARPSIVFWSGAALLLLVLVAYLRVAVGDAHLLVALARQSDWWLVLAGHPQSFARVEPGVWSQLVFDTLADRLVSGWYYLGFGWYIGLLSGFGLFLAPVVSGSYDLTLAKVSVLCGAVVLLGGLYLSRPLQAQHQFKLAIRCETMGQLRVARDHYHRAIALDPWLSLNTRFHQRIGAIDAALGETHTNAYKLFQAEQIVDDNQGTGSIWDLDSAIRNCDEVARSGESIAFAAELRAVDIRILYGLHLFQEGSFASAVAYWEQALSLEPNNWLAAYYLTLGYPATGQYRELARLCLRLLPQCQDPLTIGLMNNSLGAAYMELGQLDQSHQSFYASYKLDYLNNRTAITSLFGP